MRRRGRVDLRRTLRANLTRADLIDLRFRARKPKKTKLVLLCDVSGSMDLYSRFLLQFLFALQNVFRRVETFTFSTRLTRITDHLRSRSYRQVLRRLGEVRDWSGGTRIGESLAEFNREWGRIVDRRTIVIILSDGWDTGDPEVLGHRAAAHQAPRRAGDLAQSAARQSVVRAADPRHGGRAAARRPLRARPQPRLAPRPRAAADAVRNQDHG